jgi:hypothetical protein
MAHETLQTYASSLRSFFRYAEMQDWCPVGMAGSIMAAAFSLGYDFATPKMIPLWHSFRRRLNSGESEEFQHRRRALSHWNKPDGDDARRLEARGYRRLRKGQQRRGACYVDTLLNRLWGVNLMLFSKPNHQSPTLKITVLEVARRCRRGSFCVERSKVRFDPRTERACRSPCQNSSHCPALSALPQLAG